ncbi:MAG: class I SAM-dependent methyltransferase [Acidimicrobiales bacterium]
MNDQYFADRPTSASAPTEVTLTLPGLQLDLATDRGVFARDAVDVGTRLLLLDAPAPATTPRTMLDLGCGYGPIALTMASRWPEAELWAIDVNERARALCVANAERHGLTMTVAHPDDVPADVTFDLVWSNPPIRIGKTALHTLLTTWLDRLSPTGEAVLVVQKHLGSDSLHRWLDDNGWPTQRCSSQRGYRLLRVGSRTGTDR